MWCGSRTGLGTFPVLALLGMAAWIGGQGALANLVLERAEHDGCDQYSLLGLLQAVLERGL